MQQISQLHIGAKLADRYLVVSRLGVGGMGAVYLVDDLKLKGKQWAVKEIMLEPWNAHFFSEEAAILIHLEHPFLPKIVDFFPINKQGVSYFVMDYVKGHTLQRMFVSEKSLPLPKIMKYTLQLCQVFDYLHQLKPKPIIYRDLKPSNVMIDEQDNIRLVDFGIARRFTPYQDEDTVQLGTIGFAAPEQYLHQQTDARTDLYAIGALLYYLISGGRYYNVNAAKLEPSFNNVPQSLVELIEQLLQSNPDKRIQTAKEVQHHLEKIASKPIFQTTESKVSRHNPAAAQNRKLVIIGSLYAGSGSTFTALALAQSLNYFAIPHALVENMSNEPELYALLHGERYAPKNYTYTVEAINQGLFGHTLPWCDDYTEWHPLPPNGFNDPWHLEQVYKLLYSIAKPIVLLDISHYWTNPLVREICTIADEIIAVVGPSLSKLESCSALINWKNLLEWQTCGKSVQLIANRDAPFKFRREWIESLPLKPNYFIPELNYAAMLELQWSGRLYRKDNLDFQFIRQSLIPLLQLISPQTDFSLPTVSPKKSLKNWLK